MAGLNMRLINNFTESAGCLFWGQNQVHASMLDYRSKPDCAKKERLRFLRRFLLQCSTYIIIVWDSFVKNMLVYTEIIHVVDSAFKCLSKYKRKQDKN